MQSLSDVLNGPATDRKNGSPHKMTEAEARYIMLELEKHTRSKKARIRMAQLNSSNFTGGQSPEAIALWKRYLAALQANV